MQSALHQRRKNSISLLYNTGIISKRYCHNERQGQMWPLYERTRPLPRANTKKGHTPPGVMGGGNLPLAQSSCQSGKTNICQKSSRLSAGFTAAAVAKTETCVCRGRRGASAGCVVRRLGYKWGALGARCFQDNFNIEIVKRRAFRTQAFQFESKRCFFVNQNGVHVVSLLWHVSNRDD